MGAGRIVNRPTEYFFSHADHRTVERREPSHSYELAVDFPIRCLSGCGEVRSLTSTSDYQRDGRIITPHCNGPNFGIFVSEQIWRSGISRISYRHDGNYVIFDRDMKVVAEGREASPQWREEGPHPDAIEREYQRRMASAMNEQINRDYASILSGTHTITGTSSVPSYSSDYERHLELLRDMNIQHQREAEERRRRNQRAPAPMTEADLEREEIWRQYQMGIAATPQEELTLTYNDLLRAMNSVEALASSPKPAKPLEPRRRRAVIRRALENK